MSITWPKLSNIDSRILDGSFNKPNSFSTTQRTCWVRVFSGAVRTLGTGKDKDGNKISIKSNGVILASSNDFGIFKAAGQSTGTIYGDSKSTGDFGMDWDLKRVSTPGETALRPSPIVTGLEIKEGKDQISRECVLKLRCFTLKQMELVQTYFLEPGYSLCIEFGWNSNAGAAQMVKLAGKTDKILEQIVERNVNYEKLYDYRLKSNGDYDTFLGFIVGGTVSSDGDKWNVEVKLRGQPALPTYLQSQNRTLSNDEVGNGSFITAETYSVMETEAPAEKGDPAGIMPLRRFKAMFNDLPAMKQTAEIKSLINKIKGYDFINFDSVIAKSITEFSATTSIKLKTAGKEVSIEPEKLFSKNRYIRLSLAVQILNQNGKFNGYKIGNKKVTAQFDIDDSKIGAFPNIYSTKASKLIIPNAALPDFGIYFLTGASIKQFSNGNLASEKESRNPTNAAISYGGQIIQFPEASPLAMKEDGFLEQANYWGYLKNLYINFDVFKEKIQQKNKNVREVFLDMLNEMSSAVNSFWNFQIHEKILKADDNEKGLKKGDVILSVYDENWIGKKSDEAPHKFYHQGPNSVFLNASLDISIPSEMTGQIINRRLSLISNPDEAIVGVGGFFESDADLFLKSFTKSTDTLDVMEKYDRDMEIYNASRPQSEKLQKRKDELNQQEHNIRYQGTEGPERDKLKNLYNADGSPANMATADADIEKNKTDFKTVLTTNLQGITYTENVYGDKYNAAVARKKALEDKTEKIQKELDTIDKDIQQAQANELKAEEDQAKAAVTGNLTKIDIIVDPKWNTIPSTDIQLAINDPVKFNEYFSIYAFDDTAFFDMLKNYSFLLKQGEKPKDAEKKVTPTGLSHPLPIKYNFKILGNSGIRRGDMFNIIGIPTKYATNGLFQVTQIEHNLDGSMWTTDITGDYRQYQ